MRILLITIAIITLNSFASFGQKIRLNEIKTAINANDYRKDLFSNKLKHSNYQSFITIDYQRLLGKNKN